MCRFHLKLLGQFEARLDNEQIRRFRGDKARALLAFLAIEADVPHRRETLATTFWSELTDVKARANLRNVISNLRRILPSELFTITRQTVQLNSEFAQVDARALPMDDSDVAALYQGEFLAGLTLTNAVVFNEWRIVYQERCHLWAMQRFDQQQVDAMKAGEFEHVVSLARQQLILEPWHEIAHRQLITALLRLGRVDAAQAQYRVCERVLADELGIEPSAEIRTLIDSARNQATTYNLPAQTTPFFNRSAELNRLRDLLIDPARRWVTLVGPGGIGKTRLTLESAAQLQGDFPDGICFVPLAEVVEAKAALQREVVAEAAGRALGIALVGQDSAENQLTTWLHNRQMLLIFDNFEHLLEGGGLIDSLLSQLPLLNIVCTSREALAYRAERVINIEGLETPEEGGAADQSSSAIALFAERAEAVDDRFELNGSTQPLVANICRWVGGSPLGIELAAAALRNRPLIEVWESLQGSYRTLRAQLRDIPARQRSMQVVFHYSWQLLSETQQQLLAQLSVFRGAFSAEAAIAVTQADRVDLDAICDKSLLHRPRNGHYVLHELLRQFSAEQLSSPTHAANLAPVIERYAVYYLDMLITRSDALMGATPQYPRNELNGMLSNVRKAWDQALLSAEDERLCIGVRALSNLFQLGGSTFEAERLFRDSAETLLSRNPNSLAAAYALIETARFQMRLSRYDDAKATTQQALAIGVQHDNGWVLGMGRVLPGEIAWRSGDFAEAERLLNQSLALGREHEQPIVEAWSLHHLGISADIQQRHEDAQTHLRNAITIWDKAQFARASAVSNASLGIVTGNQQDYPAAIAALQRAFELNQLIDDKYQQTFSLISIAVVASKMGNARDAARYLSRADQIAIEGGSHEQRTLIALNSNELARNLGDFEKAREQMNAAESHARVCKSQTLFKKVSDEWLLLKEAESALVSS